MKRAKLWGIPIYYDESTQEVFGRNWVYGLALDFIVFYKVEIERVEGFPIYVEDE